MALFQSWEQHSANARTGGGGVARGAPLTPPNDTFNYYANSAACAPLSGSNRENVYALNPLSPPNSGISMLQGPGHGGAMSSFASPGPAGAAALSPVSR